MEYDRRKNNRGNQLDSTCPMTPEQVEVLLKNQEQLIKDMSDIKKYLFAGRVVIGTLVFIGLTFDWFRDHVDLSKILKF
jgi:hypothetical protein